MNEIEFEDLEFDLTIEHDRKMYNNWVEKELEINPNYPFRNRDFNKLPGIEMCIIEVLDYEESEKQLNEWILEEVSLIPNQIFNEELLKKLPINVNREVKKNDKF